MLKIQTIPYRYWYYEDDRIYKELAKHQEDFARRFRESAVVTDIEDRRYPRIPLQAARHNEQWQIEPAEKEFHKLVRDKGKLPQMMSYLHDHIDSRTGVDAFIYIQAAIEARVIDRPPYKVAVAEFPGIGKRANYDAYIGMSIKFHKRKDTLDNIISELESL